MPTHQWSPPVILAVRAHGIGKQSLPLGPPAISAWIMPHSWVKKKGTASDLVGGHTIWEGGWLFRQQEQVPPDLRGSGVPSESACSPSLNNLTGQPGFGHYDDKLSLE